jgi:bacterial/archaeal transporter family protein
VVSLGAVVGGLCVLDGDLCEDRSGRGGFRFCHVIRTFIILFAIVWFVYYTGKWSDPFALRPKTWTFLTLSGLATGASWLCYFRALKIGDAAKVAPVDKLSVVLVAIFAVIFLGERPLAKDWIGILLVAGGVVLLGWKR